MCAETGELVQELRRHIETAEYCATGLDNGVRTLNAVWAQPFGALLRDVSGLYQAQHDKQLDIMEYVAQNMRILSAHLHVAAGAYAEGDRLRAEAAMVDGEGVPKVPEPKIPRPDADTSSSSSIDDVPEVDEPVRALLDQPLWLIGDPEPLMRMAAAWRESAEELTHLADVLAATLSSQDAVWTGAAAAHYARLCENNAQGMRGLANTAAAMARGMGTCVAILQISHQWAAVMHAGYESARRGERSHDRVATQLVSHLAFQRLLAATMVRLRRAMSGDENE